MKGKLQEGHKLGGYALIGSLPGCIRQQSHRDYQMNTKIGVPAVCPYSVLLALMDDSYVYLDNVKFHLPKGYAVIMRGNQIHSGAEYDTYNVRFHMYLDTKQYKAKDGVNINWS